MIQLLLSLLTLGFLDCLNPATIATLILLIPLVKKIKHASLFIWGTFFTYIFIGLLIYYGIDKYLKTLTNKIITTYSNEVAFLGIILSVILFILGIKYSLKVIKILKNKEEIKDVKFIKITNVSPKSIILLSIISTLGDAPTGLPYILFATNLTKYNLSFIILLLLIIIYCAIYIFPMIILYICYNKHIDKFKTIEVKFKNVINTLSLYLVPIICIASSLWLIVKSLKIII